jgi:hypothetical protein
MSDDPSSKLARAAASSSNRALGRLLRLVLGPLRVLRGVGILAGVTLASFAAIPLTLLFLAGYHLSRLARRKTP